MEELGLGRKVKDGHAEKKSKERKKDKDHAKEKGKGREMDWKKEKSLPALPPPPVDPEDDLLPAPSQLQHVHSSPSRSRSVAAAVPPPTSYTTTTTTVVAAPGGLTSPSSSSFDSPDFTHHTAFGMTYNDHNVPRRHHSALAKTEWKRLSAALGGMGGGGVNHGRVVLPDVAPSITSPIPPVFRPSTGHVDEDAALHRTETRHTVRSTDARSETKSSNSGGGSSAQSVRTMATAVTEKEREKDKDKEHGKGKGKKLVKGITRGKTFNPEKWVKGFDAALDFVDGV